MSDSVSDLLASIDDVLQGAPAPAPVPVPVPAPAPVAVPAPAGPAAPVEPVAQRSTLTDVEYVRVGPAIAARLHPPRPPLPARPPAAVVKDVPPVPPVPPVPVETEAETAVKVEETEAEQAAGHWWQKKPAAETADTSVPVGAELSAETIAAAVAVGVAAGTAGGGAGTAVMVPGEPNPRWRWLLHNGGAAAAGHLALWSLSGDPMAGAHYMARMAVSVPELTAAGLTFVAAYGGWRVGGFLSGLPGRLGLAARPLGAVLAALWGAGSAPLVQSALDSAGPVGVLLSPLLAIGPLAAACWYGVDRRATRARLIPPVRWLARVPLATVVVSSLLYAPGALL
ncbi:hypothetical protein [Streptomyces sp. NBC_00304]|uniref:hypothetical protein n=1 Tax=Streptomyces sp. NBC_00304 TaxID=2975706 RepID=UPI002E27EEB4|nr:hypothetical protein [Streptomyces sp. NBC_00304]